jgi:hypothetical protein
LVDPYRARKIFAANARLVGERLEREGIEVFRLRLTEILEKTNRDSYSTIWRRAIEDHEQNRSVANTYDVLIDASRDALLGYVDRRAAAAEHYVAELLESSVVLFQRIALYVMGLYCDVFKHHLQKVISIPYFQSQFRHEVFHLLRSCFLGFPKTTKKRVLEVIEAVGEAAETEEGEDEINKKRGAYERARWLSAIRGLGDRQVDERYASCVLIAGTEPEHPDFSSYMEVGWTREISPYQAEELLSRDFADLKDILISFVEERDWKAPTRRGLAQELRKALVTNPEFFKGHLEALGDVDFDYIYEILEGYRDLWKDKKYDNWQEVLAFCDQLLRAPGFWERKNHHEKRPMTATAEWVVGAVADLVAAGTANDENAFDPENLPAARRIIETILENQSGDKFEGSGDAVQIAINSPRGRAVEALINYALRVCRLADQKTERHDEVWASELEPLFRHELERTRQNNYEFVTLFVNYLPNFLYLSRGWTIRRLPDVFDKKDRRKWICAIQGYGYVNTVYAEVYEFLRNQSHFRDALDTDDLEDQTKAKIIQHIIVAYIHGDERLDDEGGLLNWLIGRWHVDELRELTWFVWTLRSENRDDIYNKILPLWSELSKRASPDSETGKAILSRLSTWIVYIQDLNASTVELLKKAAPFADLDYNSYIVVRELRRLVSKYPEEVSEIFLSMLEGCAPTYEQEDVEHILEKLFEAGGSIRQRANAICDNYVEHGVGFPADVRARYA